MWRYVANCVREGFQRGVGHVDVRCGASSAANGPGPRGGDAGCAGNPPSVADPRGPCGRAGGSHTKHHTYGWFQRHLCEAWINAFTWSGAVVLGWYASHITCLRKRNIVWDKDLNNHHYQNFIVNHIKDMRSLSLSPIAFSQYESQDNFNVKPFKLNNINKLAVPFNISNDTVHINEEVSSAEQEFKNVVRSIENKLGIAAIEEGNAQEGVVMIQSAARKNYTPALYNLALCYEKGMGVKRDEKMAMELYKAAATRNHPGAIYNLAVFYGQGRGGLTRDPQAAEDLLRIAAASGQKEAVVALKSLITKKLTRSAIMVQSKVPEKNSSSTASFLKVIGCEENISQPTPVLLY